MDHCIPISKVHEIIKCTENGDLNDIHKLSSMELVEKYVRPFYKKIISSTDNSNYNLVEAY